MRRALIVDDNDANRYLLRAMLQGHDYVVEEARHGADALALAQLNPPDLVISDLMMPVMDGYTLLRTWRADPQLQTIPFVVYTATYTEPKDERLAMALGANAFIIKPAEPEPFMGRIEDVLVKAEHSGLSRPFEKVDDIVLLEAHNEVLIRKLEKKARELEQANRELLAEITERRRTETTLRLQDRAIQAVSQGILITDPNQPDNPIIYASAGFERMTGYRTDETVGRNCRFLQGKDTDPETVAKLREAIAGGRACAVEILNYRKNGTPFWNALSLNPIHHDNGELSYYVGIQNDITERRKLEGQLRQAQKMEAIGRLAGGVAHDFNNLLTVISGYTELMLALHEVGPGLRKSVKAISEAGERAASLTRQLLAFSRQTMLKPQVLNLNTVVENTGNLLRRLIGEDVAFTTLLDPNLRLIQVDPGHLDQIMMNLAINARDAMPRGGMLTIETANVWLSQQEAGDCREGNYVMLAMTDNGRGMTRDVLAHVFEPFFTTKEVGKGTGLGLAMVFGIVQQSGGCIRAYSEPGHGTTFKIYFPIVTESATIATSPDRVLGKKGTETILLVEDEPGVRGLAEMSLQLHGYTVLTALDAGDALRIVETHEAPIALLLTDVVMPKLSGPELARAVTARLPQVKVLYTSGYTDDSVVRHGLLEADVAFIQKPYSPIGLARKVRQVLDGDA